MFSSNRALAAAILSLTLTAGACSEPADEAADSPSASPSVAAALPKHGACGLIDKPMADAILGGPSNGPIQEGGAAGLNQCQYMHEGERVIDVRTATVVILPAPLPAMRASLGEYGKGVEEISDIGEGAIWIPAMSSLYVARGAQTISFSVTAHEMDMKAKSIDLARAGLAKL